MVNANNAPEYNFKILSQERKKQKISQENTNWVSTTLLSDRVMFKSHQASSFSTINYKIHLLIDNQDKFIDSFDEDKIKKSVRASLYLQYVDMRDSFISLKNTVNMERFYWPLSIYASKIIGTTIQAKQILQRIGQNRLKILQGLLQ